MYTQMNQTLDAASILASAGVSANDDLLTQQLPIIPKAHLGHISLTAQNPAALAAFYQELFAMQVVGGSSNGATVFLATDIDEEAHDIVFNRDPALAHIAFKLATLADLIAAYHGLRARGMPLLTHNHGVSLAVYFHDPESNVIELYWPTGRTDFHLPVIRPLNLDQSEEQIQQIVREMPTNQRGAGN